MIAVLPFVIDPVADGFVLLERSYQCVDAVEHIVNLDVNFILIGTTGIASDKYATDLCIFYLCLLYTSDAADD